MQDPALQKVINGEHQWELGTLLRQARDRLQTQLATWMGVMVIFTTILAVILLMVLQTVSDDGSTTLPDGQRIFLNFALILITAPLLGGLSMLGVRTARGESIKMLHLFDYLPQTLLLALAQLTMSLLVQLGLVVFVLPGIFLYVATSFVLQLMLDKQLRLLAAITLSVRVVYAYLMKFMLLYAFFTVLFLLAIITFGLGFLLVAPFYYVAMGTIYDELFTSNRHQEKIEESSAEVTHFDA